MHGSMPAFRIYKFVYVTSLGLCGVNTSSRHSKRPFKNISHFQGPYILEFEKNQENRSQGPDANDR